MPCEVIQSIQDLPRIDYAHQWNALSKDDNPFVSYQFFESLEKGKCVGEKSGWYPLYFIKRTETTLLAAIVVYIKTDSYGEFIFDWEWARAYQQYGLNYYPKLTLAVPYSPISAPKLLGDLSIIQKELLPELAGFYKKENFSGIHALFTNKAEEETFKTLNSFKRDSFQYHWHNKNYQDFEDYLCALRKNKRKNIKKERKSIRDASIETEWIKGADTKKEDVSFFYKCYLTTIEKKWSQAYLTKSFFQELFSSLPEQTHLLIARKNQKPIASALYLTSKTTLYGRYWGCIENIEFLHFELCIYQGVDFAIKNQLNIFEAGAQGEHKRLRGFSPVKTQSWHTLKNKEFHIAIQKFCLQEKEYIKNLFHDFEKESSYKRL